jgi:hypothetical protein
MGTRLPVAKSVTDTSHHFSQFRSPPVNAGGRSDHTIFMSPHSP